MFSKKYEITVAEIKQLIKMCKNCKKVNYGIEPAEPGNKGNWLYIMGTHKNGDTEVIVLHEQV